MYKYLISFLLVTYADAQYLGNLKAYEVCKYRLRYLFYKKFTGINVCFSSLFGTWKGEANQCGRCHCYWWSGIGNYSPQEKLLWTQTFYTDQVHDLIVISPEIAPLNITDFCLNWSSLPYKKTLHHLWRDVNNLFPFFSDAFDIDDRICSPSLKRKVELSHGNHSAMFIHQARLNEHLAPWKYNLECKFQVDATPYNGMLILYDILILI